MFARHFEAQAYDNAGKIGVQLQKIILFLVFAAVLSLVDLRVSTIVGVVIMVTVYAAGVHGAARRNRCALSCYAVLMSIYVALTVALLVFLLVMTIYARATAPVEDAEDAVELEHTPSKMVASMMPGLPPMVHAMLGRNEAATVAPTAAPESSSDSESEAEVPAAEDYLPYRSTSPWFYVIAALYFFVCMVTFALKVYTIKLATEMHRHLLAAEAAGSTDSSSRSSCCRMRMTQKSEPVDVMSSSLKTAPAEVVYVPACYPPGVNDEVTPGASSYPPNCYQPLNKTAEH